MEALIVILLYAFKLAFLASLACVKTKEFSLKSEVKKAYLHAHKRILIMPSIMKEVYSFCMLPFSGIFKRTILKFEWGL